MVLVAFESLTRPLDPGLSRSRFNARVKRLWTVIGRSLCAFDSDYALSDPFTGRISLGDLQGPSAGSSIRAPLPLLKAWVTLDLQEERRDTCSRSWNRGDAGRRGGVQGGSDARAGPETHLPGRFAANSLTVPPILPCGDRLRRAD
jgi:hypothetical protein